MPRLPTRSDRDATVASCWLAALIALAGVCAGAAQAADAAAGKAEGADVRRLPRPRRDRQDSRRAQSRRRERRSTSTRQLEGVQSGERQHEQMSIIAQGLSDEDIADLAAWYASMKITAEMPQ